MTDADNTKALLACPFCGGEPERVNLTDDDNFGGSCITCKKCGASSPVHFDRKENLDSSWNKRSSASRPTEGELAEIRKRHDDIETLRHASMSQVGGMEHWVISFGMRAHFDRATLLRLLETRTAGPDRDEIADRLHKQWSEIVEHCGVHSSLDDLFSEALRHIRQPSSPTVQAAEATQVRERLRDETEITHLIRVYADEVRKRNSHVGEILCGHAPYINEILEAHLKAHDSAIRADERGRTAQWRDIATAPKDGTAFLAYGLHTEDEPIGAARGVKAGDHWWAILLFDIWQQHRFRFAKDGTFPWSEPTHWMPLPSPPPQPTKQESPNG